MWQCGAICCNAVCRGVLSHFSRDSGMLQCVAVCCNVMEGVAVRCNVLQRVAVIEVTREGKTKSAVGVLVAV